MGNLIKKLFVTFGAISLLIISLSGGSASAVTGSDWQAGRIADDSVFFNGTSMNVSEVQTFLNYKVPSCDTNGTQPYGSTGMTRAEWAAANGKPQPPYICLKDFRQDVPGMVATAYCNATSAGNKSAAEIIVEVSNACGVSPKVLIVLLQKEQSLITDDWPWPIQYTKATGYGCPDSDLPASVDANNNGCYDENEGFFKQIYYAARIYKYYAANPSSFNHRAGRDNFVRYNPNTNCGGGNVYIHNQATAGLYNYTPYQPNQAALNNLYGTGDSCSAYGNRNFWRMFNDWFGSTYGASFSWSLVTQSLYTDETKTTGAGNSLVGGTRVYAVIKVRNTGNQIWTKDSANTVRLGSIRPLERRSAFCDSTWLSCSRPASMVENTVAPSEIATFEFWLKAPPNGASYNEYFGPVVEGIQWMPDIGMYYLFHVQSPIYSWQITSQYAYTDSNKTAQKNLADLISGDRVYIGFTAKNTGNVTWKNDGPNPVRVGTLSPTERSSAFYKSGDWLGPSRPATLKEATVAPGGTGTFEFWITAPSSGGTYNERFGLLAEGLTWFNDTGLSYYTKVTPKIYAWDFMGQWAYADVNRTVLANMNDLQPGEKVYVRIWAKNVGNVTWLNSGPNAVMVGTANPLDRISSFAAGSGWLSNSRPVLMQNASIAPGQTATFEFTMTAPSTIGVYHERFNLIANNLTWFNDEGLSYFANVKP